MNRILSWLLWGTLSWALLTAALLFVPPIVWAAAPLIAVVGVTISDFCSEPLDNH